MILDLIDWCNMNRVSVFILHKGDWVQLGKVEPKYPKYINNHCQYNSTNWKCYCIVHNIVFQGYPSHNPMNGDWSVDTPDTDNRNKQVLEALEELIK